MAFEKIGTHTQTGCPRLQHHYEAFWGPRCTFENWRHGPVNDLPNGFRVLRFERTSPSNFSTYATCCLSMFCPPIELHLHAPREHSRHVETLYVVSHFHVTGGQLDVGHTVFLGRPWLPGSKCDHLLVSLPYLDGPNLERLPLQGADAVCRCLWLLPITSSERAFKIQHGLEALESRLEEGQFDYLDPERESVV